jgi:DNA-directed RNA polymerase
MELIVSGAISKKSLAAKQEWVDSNIQDIINFDNGKLLSKANDKLLFLAFCIEFKRFHEFILMNQLYNLKLIQLYNWMLHVKVLNIWLY